MWDEKLIKITMKFRHYYYLHSPFLVMVQPQHYGLSSISCRLHRVHRHYWWRLVPHVNSHHFQKLLCLTVTKIFWQRPPPVRRKGRIYYMALYNKFFSVRPISYWCITSITCWQNSIAVQKQNINLFLWYLLS